MTIVGHSSGDVAGTPADRLVVQVLGFLRVLQDDGFQVGVGERLDALKVCRHCSVTDRKRMQWGLRALVATNPEEWHRFYVLFQSYWLRVSTRSQLSVVPRKYADSGQVGKARDNGSSRNAIDIECASGVSGDDGTGQEGVQGGASSRESLDRGDFRFINDAERLHRMENWVEQLARRMKPRITRRQQLYREGRRIHFRHTIRNSLPHGGTPLNLEYLRRRRKLPRLLLLLDVSRSMKTYSYLFLRFARGIVSVFRDAEVFVFHTRLVHVTDALRHRNIEQVKQKLAVMSLGWSGGTRIGESLQSFNDKYGRRLLNRRSIVVVLSDGLDTGAPELLASQVALLRRRSRKVIWLNPLIGREGYQPLAAGMQAALPFVDLFASAHNFASLRSLESAFVNV